jgi:hypothetical protein
MLGVLSDHGSKCPIRGCRVHAANAEDANEMGYSVLLAERIHLPVTLLGSTQDAEAVEHILNVWWRHTWLKVCKLSDVPGQMRPDFAFGRLSGRGHMNGAGECNARSWYSRVHVFGDLGQSGAMSSNQHPVSMLDGQIKGVTVPGRRQPGRNPGSLGVHAQKFDQLLVVYPKQPLAVVVV